MAIYFIQAGKNGPIKIGQSNDVETRLAQLQTANPYELKLLWVYYGDCFSESDIHAHFAHENIRGEWFRPSRTLKAFIQEELANSVELEPQINKDRYELFEHPDGTVGLDTDLGFDISITSDTHMNVYAPKTHPFLDRGFTIYVDRDIEIKGR